MVSNLKSGKYSAVIRNGYVGEDKFELIFMQKYWCKAIDFVELVFDSQWLNLWAKLQVV